MTVRRNRVRRLAAIAAATVLPTLVGGCYPGLSSLWERTPTVWKDPATGITRLCESRDCEEKFQAAGWTFDGALPY